MAQQNVSALSERFKRDTASRRDVPPMVAAVLAEMFTFYRQPFTETDARIYWRALRSVSGIVLRTLLDEAMSTRVFLPKPSELTEDLSRVIAQVVAAHKFIACATCGSTSTPGWIEVEDPNAEPRYALRYTKELYFDSRAEPRWRQKLVLDADGKPVLDALPAPKRIARCACYAAWETRLGLPASPKAPTLQLDAPSDHGVTSAAALVTRFKQRLKVEGENR